MKIRDMHDYIKNTKQFQEFINGSPDACFGAGFFIIDFQNPNANEEQLDYYIPSTKRIASFKLSGEFKISEQLVEKPLDEIDINEVKLSIDDIIEIVKAEMNKREIAVGMQKIIAVLQKINLEVIWSISAILTSSDFAKIRIRDIDASVAKFEKINLMSLIDVRSKKPLNDKIDDKNILTDDKDNLLIDNKENSDKFD